MAQKDPPRIIAIELTPRSMLCLLEHHGFVPKDNEVFIDRLFAQYKALSRQEQVRFKKYIGTHGTEFEIERVLKLKIKQR